ncbi:TPA: hypothetical protein L5X69_000699 [Pseudomonas aeruginosa]|uniref:hypothetical protein n=1 Tax=Pseudomonas aeruginosa TaxID=287 RepID=UPI0008A9217F|nr:hypothetical protein [Pseudomonas aeruginosa]OHP05235.1 hypothetical protein HMPREF2659_09520 [Pseudomonas aeruginosa]QKZ43851.1 hypothetical protein HWN45_10055 [Pseudomonas aeruginosa]HBP2507920.1 hypothetical protein [Pseudomonas aeruginosa]HBP2582194.1 hypothetical protein [Pseudomonas aeruginosa]HBP2589385.1 hypothetical protein [Pseudomonas aeruginosa]
MDWLRWWHGTVTDPKFQRVARMAGASTGEVIAVWACLLERASSVTAGDAPVTSRGDAETRGSVTGFDCDDHDVLLGFEDGTTAKIFAALEDRGLLVEGRIARWEERQPVRADSSKERTRAWRARKKGQQEAPEVTPGDDGVTQGDALDKEGDKRSPPSSPPPGKAAPKPRAKSERAKPKTKVPDPFLVTTGMLDWARERGLAVNTDTETERFLNYFRGEGKTKADWAATWRNWMLKAQEDLEQRAPRRSQKGTHGPDLDDTNWANDEGGGL